MKKVIILLLLNMSIQQTIKSVDKSSQKSSGAYTRVDLEHALAAYKEHQETIAAHKQQQKIMRLQQEALFQQLKKSINTLTAAITTGKNTAQALRNFMDLHYKKTLQKSANILSMGQFLKLVDQYDEAAKQIQKDLEKNKHTLEIKACLTDDQLKKAIMQFNEFFDAYIKQSSLEEVD